MMIIMNVKAIMVISLAFAVTALSAMPTKDEIKRVQPVTGELMLAHVKDYKANRKSAKEVGDAAVRLAKDANGEAAKYVLLKGAIHYYSLAREFDMAADALEMICSRIGNVPPKDVEAIASKALSRAGKGDALRLRNIQHIASEQAKAVVEIAACKAELNKNPRDAAAMHSLARAYVRFGDWPSALKVFAALGDEAAIYECSPEDAKKCNALKAADYWWGYSTNNPAPYRAHAAVLYRRALTEGLASGLMKNLVEKRIAEVEASYSENTPKATPEIKPGDAAAGGSQQPQTHRTAKVVEPKDLVINGSFEADAVADESYDASAAITGWSKDGEVSLVRKNSNYAFRIRNEGSTVCFINKGASISQTINVPERMNYKIALTKANKSWLRKPYWTLARATGHVMIDDKMVIPDLLTLIGKGQPFSATVELLPGPHTLKIACTGGKGMSVDNVTVTCVPLTATGAR